MSKEIDDIIRVVKVRQSFKKKLYDFTYLSLANVVSLYVKDDSPERDWVFNQCMLKVYNSLNSFTLGSNYLAWARTIIVRNSIDHARSHIRHLTIITSIENVKCEEKKMISWSELLGQLAADDIVKPSSIFQSMKNLFLHFLKLKAIAKGNREAFKHKRKYIKMVTY